MERDIIQGFLNAPHFLLIFSKIFIILKMNYKRS